MNGGFQTLGKQNSKLKNSQSFDDEVVVDPYGSCQNGDIYGYGHFTNGYGDGYGAGYSHGFYGYGACSEMDDYSLGRDLTGYEYSPPSDQPAPAAPELTSAPDSAPKK